MPDMKPEEVVKIFEDGADYWRALKSPAVAHHIRSHDSMAASIRSLIAERDARDLALEDARETIQTAWPEDPLGDSFDLADAIDRLIAERDEALAFCAEAEDRASHPRHSAFACRSLTITPICGPMAHRSRAMTLGGTNMPIITHVETIEGASTHLIISTVTGPDTDPTVRLRIGVVDPLILDLPPAALGEFCIAMENARKQCLRDHMANA